MAGDDTPANSQGETRSRESPSSVNRERVGAGSVSSRRRFLQAAMAAGSVGITSMLAGCGVIFRPPSLFGGGGGGGSNVKARPIQFRAAKKRITRKMATDIVDTWEELVTAVDKPGATVWIPGSVKITVPASLKSDRRDIQAGVEIAQDVTIASNRALKSPNAPGALIVCDHFIDGVFFQTEGTVRITGLRARGPRMKYWDPPGDADNYASAAFALAGKQAIVDQCEMFGWTNAALLLGARNTPTQGWIHHNQLHHNQMNHLGYHLELYNGMHLIEWNYLARYRHAISGYGYTTNGYEARCNVVGPPGGAEYAFAFDMHSLGEQPNFSASNTTGGKYVNAHHNVFQMTEHNALSLSGYPAKYARFCNNWCATSRGGAGSGVPAVSAPSGANVRKKNNIFGQDAVSKGRQRLQALSAKIPLSNGKPSLAPWKVNIK
jgi:hypothetical protein